MKSPDRPPKSQPTARVTSAGKGSPCPNCGSRDVARISYGMPIWSEDLDREMAAGEVQLGGCLISSGSPRRHCNACDRSF